MNNNERIMQAGRQLIALLEELENPVPCDFTPMINKLLARRETFLSLSAKHRPPFYILDLEELNEAISEYVEAFEKSLPDSSHFYAVKLNHHPVLLQEVVKRGMKLDVSSGRELQLALEAGADEIVFSGPGKSAEELGHVFGSKARITVHLDSFYEMELLNLLATSRDTKVRAGVRVFADHFGSWGKFGIPLSELKAFFDRASKLPGIELAGIQFHLSWNRDAEPYSKMIEALAEVLSSSFTAGQRESFEFIDIGGGFRPYRTEGVYPWKIPSGEVRRVIDRVTGATPKLAGTYFEIESVPIEEYARGIGEAVDTWLRPLGEFQYYTEPGRIIANNAMHILLQVVDCKRPDCVIADGGINLLGWERFEHDYFPLLNLTHPSATEQVEGTVYGSLCMPQDLWGYSVYGEKVEQGDILLVPYQGALTYSLAQEFIKPIAPVYVLECAGKH